MSALIPIADQLVSLPAGLGSFPVLVRPDDQTTRTLACGYLLQDADDPSWSNTLLRGDNLFPKGGGYFSGDGTVQVASASYTTPARNVFRFTGSQHFVETIDPIDDSLQCLSSFSILMRFMLSSATLALIDSFSLPALQLLTGYDVVANTTQMQIRLFGNAGNKGFTFDPGPHGGANNFNVFWPGSASGPTYAAARPPTDQMAVLRWDFDALSMISNVYFHDGAAPVVTHLSTGTPLTDAALKDARYWLGSFGPGSNTVSWRDDIQTFQVMDMRDLSTAATPAQLSSIMSDWRATDGIA